MTSKTRLLAIDPGTREFGYAEFSGSALVDHNVVSLRRYNPPDDRVEVLGRVMTKLMLEKTPDAIALEKNGFFKTEQNQHLMKAIRKIKTLARRQGIPAYEIPPGTAKKIATGNGWATKKEVARALCSYYPDLKVHLNQKSRWKERYEQNMFDAVACGLAWLSLRADHKLDEYAVEK